EEDVDGVGRRKDDQRRTVQGLDRVAHSVVGGQAANFQRRDLHYRGAQVDELTPERIDLMARSGDQDAAAVERALRQRVQTIRHLHAWTQDQERVAAQAICRGLAGKLTQWSADAV